MSSVGVITLFRFGWQKSKEIEKGNNEESKKPLTKEDMFISFLKYLFHQQFMRACLTSMKPVFFNFFVEESPSGPLFVYTLNKKRGSVNIREAMKLVRFNEDGDIVYGPQIVDLVIKEISSGSDNGSDVSEEAK